MNTYQDVHAPFHFVPLSKWVYMPEWADQVSHDVPFADGVSGSIEYELTNLTPMCVGSKSGKEAGKGKDGISIVKWERDSQGNLTIPQTSLKGLIRHALEIASFAKFNSVDNNHFSYRELDKLTPYSDLMKDTSAQAYWLRFDDTKKKWVLRKVKHTLLFHDEFNDFSKCNMENIPKKQFSEQKFRQWPLNKAPIFFDLGDRKIIGTKGKPIKLQRATNLGNGRKKGHPVFSSYRISDERYQHARMSFSYLFYDEDSEEVSFTGLDELVQKLFSNHRPKQVEYLHKNPHPELGIPVFAREKNNILVALGFCKMPRALYQQSVGDLVSHSQKLSNSNHIFDLPELMFGTIRDTGLSLKSRVSFSDAKCNNSTPTSISTPVILSSPKASYLNAYIEQKANSNHRVKGRLSNYQKGSSPKGWKYYPVKPRMTMGPPSNNSRVQSKLELVEEGAVFSGKVVFHNLKPAELGALLWVMTLGNDSNHCHSFGHGKPLGAGAVQMDVKFIIGDTNNGESLKFSDHYLSVFEKSMEDAYPGESWSKSSQICHLKAFTDIGDNTDKPLQYMKMKKGGDNMTYVGSLKGASKRILPNWVHQDEILERSENVQTPSLEKTYELSKGRLSNLLPCSVIEDQK